jgi:pimeloyl-ACP methyl ester carboxylesterase
MERLIPDAGLVVFEGAGHFAYLDEPQRFCTIARHFLTPKVAR